MSPARQLAQDPRWEAGIHCKCLLNKRVCASTTIWALISFGKTFASMKDFGMMADIDEEERYGLFGLVIGLQNKDLPLVTENLLKVSTRAPDTFLHP